MHRHKQCFTTHASHVINSCCPHSDQLLPSLRPAACLQKAMQTPTPACKPACKTHNPQQMGCDRAKRQDCCTTRPRPPPKMQQHLVSSQLWVYVAHTICSWSHTRCQHTAAAGAGASLPMPQSPSIHSTQPQQAVRSGVIKVRCRSGLQQCKARQSSGWLLLVYAAHLLACHSRVNRAGASLRILGQVLHGETARGICNR